jgi:hypothetical protein
MPYRRGDQIKVWIAQSLLSFERTTNLWAAAYARPSLRELAKDPHCFQTKFHGAWRKSLYNQ